MFGLLKKRVALLRENAELKAKNEILLRKNVELRGRLSRKALSRKERDA